ncbi:hypothetical protein APR41_17675 [Salegentibacter salinarum]|uniref:Fimbrial assembly protein n=1 Tax=Salegentibacter salinarum TaxID=447422 RepID=A0A2N0TVQ1_9FLAO|nr:hypothetical protein [Salegentibacter salinarum]PKD18738.1 hypothetical protein APR41_17675 [Salegentibacter salinarum]SKB98613.1 hypothetical protein SAMN05660903_03640 [Salegentibacter salinarum]
MSSLSHYWNYGKEYTAIDWCQLAADTTEYYLLTSTKKKGELELKELLHLNNLETLISKLKKNQHTYLNISGNQVLIKTTAKTSGNHNSIVESAFPNLDLKEFYFQVISNETESIVTICRRNYVEGIIDTLAKEGVVILGISLGFTPLLNITSLLGELEIETHSHSLVINKNTIVNFNKNDKILEEQQYDIDGIPIGGSFLISLSCIFYYFKNDKDVFSNIAEKNYLLKTKFRQKQFFKQTLIIGLSFILICLLINFFIFTNMHREYQSRQNQFEIEVSQREIQENKIKEVQRKKELVAEIMRNSNSNSTLYLNRISSQIPTSITLNNLIYQPLEKRIKENSPVELSYNDIILQGESKDKESFSSWIQYLEDIPWIKELAIENFGFISQNTSEFTLNIELKDESEK